ncbi:hypothetical protein Xenpb_01030 [Xenorhabdus sp. PB62.4]|nr:hypothetical protein [Xenorhabdus sp. PB62.4]
MLYPPILNFIAFVSIISFLFLNSKMILFGERILIILEVLILCA